MTPGGPGVTGYNPYAYAGENPVTFTDPSGRMELAAPGQRTCGEYCMLLIVAVVAVVGLAAFGTDVKTRDQEVAAALAEVEDLLRRARKPGPSPLPTTGIPPIERITPEQPDDRKPRTGETVYRVGDSSTDSGSTYWTPQDPRNWSALDYRDAAGLPDQRNSGTWLVEGTLTDITGVVGQEAARMDPPLSYCHYAGTRVWEFIVPHPNRQIQGIHSSPLVPPYGGRPAVCPDGSVPA
jgi:hypothetical protein